MPLRLQLDVTRSLYNWKFGMRLNSWTMNFFRRLRRSRSRRLILEQVEARRVLSGLSVFDNDYWHQDVANVDDISEVSDLFGAALATGDFDGDDFLDLAIGVPGENGGGAVNILYGSAGRLETENGQFWTEGNLLLASDPSEFSLTGFALATGDFDNNGIDDLAIGIPGATIDGAVGAGAVAMLYGERGTGLVNNNDLWHQNIDSVRGVANTGDAFGSSLATGDFNGDGIDDLAVGVPSDTIDGVEDAGGFAVLYGRVNASFRTDNDQYWHQNITDPLGNVVDSAEEGDLFGFALAAGDFNDDGISDLAIGVPGEDVDNQSNTLEDAGAVHIIFGSRSFGGLSPENNEMWHQDVDGVDETSAATGDEFGYALVVGNFDGNSFPELAIGIPGENGNAGQVQVLTGAAGGLTATFDQVWDQDRIEGQVAESGDRFGSSLVSGDFLRANDIDELLVGAPDEVLDGLLVGNVSLIQGSREGLTESGSLAWRPADLGLPEEAGESFGFALTGGDFNNDRLLDLAIGNPDDEPTSVQNSGSVSVLYGNSDSTSPAVTVEQADAQEDPTGQNTIRFDVVFSEPVSGFTAADVQISGTAGATNAVVTGSVATYQVEISGMVRAGTVIVTIPAGAAIDAGGNPNLVSTSIDNEVTYEVLNTVTIEQAATQEDPTSDAEIRFVATFESPVSDFTAEDVVIGGDTGADTVTITGSGTTYTVIVSGMKRSGTVEVSIPAKVVTPENASSFSVDNQVDYQLESDFTVTINQAEDQADPTTVGSIRFDVVFSKPAIGFDASDVQTAGTAIATSVDVVGSGEEYTVTIGGLLGSGTVIAFIPEGAAVDSEGNVNLASTSDDNTVQYQLQPSVTVEQAASQADPTSEPVVRFTAQFSSRVTGFTASDVTLSGSAGATTVEVVGSGNSYELLVSGMTRNGTVVVDIPAGVVSPPNSASSSSDNIVNYEQGTNPEPVAVTVNQAANQADPTSVDTIRFAVNFSQPVTGFTAEDVRLGGTAGADSVTISGSGTTYELTVSGMTQSGTVTASVLGNSVVPNNTASTSSDNSVQYQIPASTTVTINQAAGQDDPTTTSPILFIVEFSAPVTGFTAGDVQISGSTGADTVEVVGSGRTYEVRVSGMTSSGSVFATIPPSVVTPSNAASSSSDNIVEFVAGSASGWTNPNDPLDVNNDGFVTAIDVLRIITEINNPEYSNSAGELIVIDTMPPSRVGYIDVTGDGFVTTRDALQVINFINSNLPSQNAALAALSFSDQQSKDLSSGSDDEEDEDQLTGQPV